MLKLSLILESDDWWIHDYYRIKDQMNDEFGSGDKHQSWRLVPKKLLKLTWMTFVKYGRVNERALEKIWEIIAENVIKISINSDIRDGRDVDIFGKEEYSEVSDEEWKRFFNFISDQGEKVGYGRGGDWDVEKGHARYSDNASALFKLAGKAESAATPEEKLIAIDQILNFIHGIGYMAKWFVEGGVESLIDLRDMEVKGIQLTGQLREEVFYRGESGSKQRIKEPFTVAKQLGAIFASEKQSSTRNYGHNLTTFTSLPTTKILRFDSPMFWRLLGRRRPPNGWIGSVVKPGETLIDIVNQMTQLAYDQGYDAVVFSPTDDIGTMIFNPKAFQIEKPVLKEEGVAGKTFMVVDVQPEYKQAMPTYMVQELVQFITANYEQMGQLVFLYNGHDTLDMIDETSYKMWWIENGLDENIVEQADFYDKGYAFFRYCMDSGGASEESIANFVRFMYENDIRDSRDMDRDMWAKYLREYRRTDRKEVMDLLRHQSDCIHVPDLMDFLKRYTNLVICGGGINECLKEVEIALQALRKPYDVEQEFTY